MKPLWNFQWKSQGQGIIHHVPVMVEVFLKVIAAATFCSRSTLNLFSRLLLLRLTSANSKAKGRTLYHCIIKFRKMDGLRHFPSEKCFIFFETEEGVRKKKSQEGQADNESETLFRMLLRHESAAGTTPSPRVLNFLRRGSDSWTGTVARIQTKLRGGPSRKKGKLDDDRIEKEKVEDINLCWKDGDNRDGKTDTFSVWDVFGKQEASALIIGGLKYDIVYNPPHVDLLKLEVCLIANFPVVPKVDLRNAEVLSAEFSWFVQLSDEEFPPVLSVVSHDSKEKLRVEGFEYRGGGFSFLPTESDIGKQLCVVCKPGRDSQVVGSLCQKSRIVEMGEECIWQRRQEDLQILPDRHEYECLIIV